MQVMLDTVGPELYIQNSSLEPIELKEGAFISLTSDRSKPASASILPVNFDGLVSVRGACRGFNQCCALLHVVKIRRLLREDLRTSIRRQVHGYVIEEQPMQVTCVSWKAPVAAVLCRGQCSIRKTKQSLSARNI